MSKRLVGINERGLRVGEDHHNAKLTNDEVERIRSLRAEGIPYLRLAEIFEVSKSTIQMVCQYKRRAEIATDYKQVHVKGSGPA